MVLRNLLIFTTILLTIGWVLGFFVWQHKGYTIHSLLILAVISGILAITRKTSRDSID